MSFSSAAMIAALGVALATGWRLAAGHGAAASALAARLFHSMAWAYLVLGWVGILLAEAGEFSSGPLLLGCIGVLGVAVSLGRPVRGSGAENRHGAAIAWVGLSVLVWVFATPIVDTRYEARDAGVYRLTAARLERTGRLAYHDGLLAGLPKALRERAFPIPDDRSASRSMGFYIDNPDTARVVPQFMPFAPVVMAEGRLLAGVRGAEGALLLVAVLGMMAVFTVARELGGGFAGVLAGTWTAANLAIWWFVRAGTAEIFAMTLVMIAVSALIRERRDSVALDGLMAGAAFGLVWLTKMETLLLGLPLGILFLYDIAAGRIRTRSTQVMWGTIFALSVHFFVHAWGWSHPYFRDVLLVPEVTPTAVTLAAVVMLAAAIGLWWWRVGAAVAVPAFLRDLDDPASGWSRRVNGALLATMAAMMVYGYWLRPDDWDRYNLRDLGWVTSEVGLVAAWAGAAWLLLSPRRPPGSGSAVAVLLAMCAMVLYNRQIIPYLLWAYRRFAVFAVPTTLILAAVAVARLVEHARARLRGGGVVAATVAFALALVVALSVSARELNLAMRYRSVHDLQGAAELIDQLEAGIEANALVIFEPRTRRGLIRLEGVLQHELGIDVLRLAEPELDRELVEHLLFNATRAGRPVYLMTSGYLVSASWLHATPVTRFVLDTTILEEPWEELPQHETRMYLDARLYRLAPGGGLAALDGRLDVGDLDDLYLDGRTVHQAEIEPGGRNYRWTYDPGRFFLPGLGAGDARILIRMASSYPPEQGRQRVRVVLDSVELGEVVVGRGWTDYSFDVPGNWSPSPDSMPALEIIAEPVWKPAEILASPDPRAVGVAVDLIRWGN